MGKRDFLTVDALTPDELHAVLDDADELKARRRTGGAPPMPDGLAGASVGMLFEKPSTRTRVSLEVAASELGAHSVVLQAAELQLGRGEPIEDTGRVLSGYLDALAVRTAEHARLERLAAASSVPVINALSEATHPCQALADLHTIREHKGHLAGLRLAFVGDGNNVAHSLLVAGAMAGMRVVAATPADYAPRTEPLERARALAQTCGGEVAVTTDPQEAVAVADAVATDVWASMGQEADEADRAAAMTPFQLNAALLGRASPEAIVLHCLPAHRGEEITAEVLDGPASVAWAEAENRLHTQKALLRTLLGGS
jgi:ornithine carbamoyltransferase